MRRSSRELLPMHGVVAIVLATSVLPVGCGDGSESRGDSVPASAPSQGPHHTVRITDDGYEPDELRIEVGDRVTFVNRSQSRRPHSAADTSRGAIDPSPGDGPTDHSGKTIAYAGKRGFATHALFAGEPQTVVFRAPRRYVYHCSFDPDMEGVVVVRP